MRRLTYSPHAWVFIRSTNLGGRIYDVSDDCVRGSVTQVVGDVCKAQFELRNRFKKWLRDPVTKESIFLPMDLVTIWLQRLPGSPIQQLTGYLDSVPYYQGYPGNAMFTATCTLKKAAFTWFDPGVATFQQWLISHGWALNPASGQAINPVSNFSVGPTAKNTPLATNVNDGGFGDLLARFMVEVALWRANDVLVSDLPRDLPKIAASLYKSIADEATQDLDALNEFMRQAMGVKGTNLASVASTVDPTTGTIKLPQNVSGSVVINTKALSMVQAMKKAAADSNIPPIELAYIARVMTNFDETYSHGQDDGARWGYGIYGLRPNNTLQDLQQNPVPVLSIGANNYTINDLLDVARASEAMCLRLRGGLEINANWLTGAKRGDLQSMHDWAAQATRQSIDYVTGALDDANQFIGIDTPTPNAGGAQSVDPNSVAWDSPSLQNLLTDQEKSVISQYYKSKAAWLPALAYRAKYFNTNLRVARPPSSYKLQNDQLYIAGQGNDLDAFFNSLKGDATIDQVQRIGPSTTTQQLTRGTVSNNFTVFLATANAVIITQTKPAGFVAAAQTVATSSGGGSNSPPGDVSFQDMAAFSATSAFAANFALPVDIIASQLLTGEKALMNDISCLDAIKQFAAASMRAFRTLPDGRFLAFYPDYFGAYRDPYWKIENIELIDFGIQLNDEALATHVYVSGDTFDFNGQVDLQEQVGTAGVATINHAAMLQSFIEPWSKDTSIVGKLATAYDFLQHYGARPLAEDQPLIRNTTYEFLYAWQKFMLKWSQQFSTSVEFTFHPEIMAGGLIEFPDHHVQCFIEQVTHSWDYESGFTSDAVLTAPSLPKGHRGKGSIHPGFALAGNINSVGVMA